MQTTTNLEAGAQVLIPVDRVNLEGEIVLPAQPRGLVLFAHGSGSSRHSPRNQFVARVLREANLGTLLFDLLTVGEERIDARTGHLRFDIALLARRLLGATQWVVRQSNTSSLGIGYFGSSTGAAAALAAAAELGDRVGCIVSRGGRPDLAGSALEKVKAATLLIVGGNDKPLIEMNQAAHARMRCEKAVEIIPGATHLFEEPGALERVAHLASDWFVKHFEPRAGGKA
jgi:putative phosphoribosyl transferase